MLAFGLCGLALECFEAELLRGEVAKEDDDAVVGGIAFDSQPDVEGVGVEGFELRTKAFVHAAAIVFDVGRAFVDGCGKGFVEVYASEVAALGDDLAGTAIEKGEVIPTIEEDDRIGGGLKKLLHLPEE